MTANDVVSGSQPIEDPSCANTPTGPDPKNEDPPSQKANLNDDDDSESTYHLKWIQWNSGKIPIVMQSINGPCPLIATMNVLLLREKVKLPSMLEQITATQLLTYLGECIMDSVPTGIENDENAMLNLEQNMHDAMEILPKLKTGLDVNIRFTGITDFEYTPECIIFDLLRIPLYHGWLCDPDLNELRDAIGSQSYNQLVDSIITNKNSQDPEISTRVLIAEEFLERTASQLTLYGLNQLKSSIKDNEIGILFRNNHFLTLMKRDNEIYTLVTDHGYLTEDNIIWEILDNIEGAGRFFDSDFQSSEVTNRQVSEFQAIDKRQQQLEFDYLMALSLKEEERLVEGKSNDNVIQEDDFALAKRLQDEENEYYDSLRIDRASSRNISDHRHSSGISQLSRGPNRDNQIVPSSSLSEFPPLPRGERSASLSHAGVPSSDLQSTNAVKDRNSQQQMVPKQEQSQPSRPALVPTQIAPSERILSETQRNVPQPGPTLHQQQSPSNRPQSSGRKQRGSQKDSNCIVS